MPCDKKNNQACHKDYCFFSPGTVMPCRLKSPISFHKFTSCSHKKNPVLIRHTGPAAKWEGTIKRTTIQCFLVQLWDFCVCHFAMLDNLCIFIFVFAFTQNINLWLEEKDCDNRHLGKMRMYKNLPLERSCWHPPWQHVERYSLVQTAGHFLWTKQHTHTQNAGFKVKCRQTQKYRHLSEQNKQVCGIEENRIDFSKSAKPKTPQLPTWSSHTNTQLLPLLC